MFNALDAQNLGPEHGQCFYLPDWNMRIPNQVVSSKSTQ